jgi:hypothetical protein
MKEMKILNKICPVLIGMIFFTEPTYAYVDPGILGSAYQLFYMLFFGVLVGVVTRPWLLIKGVFKKYFYRFIKKETM